MITVGTWNVGGALDVEAAATVLRAAQPDVLCVLEPPSRLGLRRLAKAAGMQVAHRAGGRRTGAALLTRGDARVLSSNDVELDPAGGAAARHAAHAIVGVGSTRISVLAVQLGLRPEARAHHAEQLLAFLATIDLPSVVGADLNEAPGGPAGERLTARYVDAFAAAGTGRGDTYPTPEPSARYDVVLVDPALLVRSCAVHTDPPVDVVSHHRPVLATLGAPDEVPGRAEPTAGAEGVA
ncbi:MAG: endonuclease/exonuclease/phosphatase family protein [Actinomycetes bacterium]